MARTTTPSERTAVWARPGAIFLAALALRLPLIWALDSPRLAESGVPWDFGAEAACLASSLHEGRGYGDPWGHGTGPSSWLTPPYPALVALLMALFGGVTRATAAALFALQCAASAATAPLLALLGRRLGREREGILAAWLWALYPIGIWHAVHTVWDTTFAALGVTAFLAVLAGSGASLRGAAQAGSAYGALLFLNPAPIAVAPAALGYLAWKAGGARRALGACGAFLLAALLVCLPWMLRNRAVLGSLTLRPNFGVELRIGNHAAATGRPVPFKYHPSHIPAELAKYRALGEVEYSRENARRALDWIRAHPADFAALTLKRAAFFWIGETPLTDTRRAPGAEGERIEPAGDWNSWLKFAAFALTGALALAGLAWGGLRGRERLLVAGVLILFGAPYYLTHVSERYRFPIDPLIILAGTCLLARAAGRAGRKRGLESAPA